MNYFETQQSSSVESEQKKFMSRVYGWMALALVISFGSALLTAIGAATNPALAKVLYNGVTFLILAIAELVLVWVLSASIRTMSLSAATTSFIAYSVLNGITLSVIFLAYSINSIAYIFLASAAMFGGMSIYGAKTKQSLYSAGRYLMMALIGIIVASCIEAILSIFMRTTMLDWIISLVTVVVFTGLTAYDTQRMMSASAYADGSETYKKASIIGALELYLDFINIFLSMLRLFGRSRN
jgi:uncharacterized protein